KYDRQCIKCKRLESPTSGTLFHHCNFPLLKAFYIVYYVSTSKNGISSTELSKKLVLRQKTSWVFKQKVMKAMASGGNHPSTKRWKWTRRMSAGMMKSQLAQRRKEQIMVVAGA